LIEAVRIDSHDIRDDRHLTVALFPRPPFSLVHENLPHSAASMPLVHNQRKDLYERINDETAPTLDVEAPEQISTAVVCYENPVIPIGAQLLEPSRHQFGATGVAELSRKTRHAGYVPSFHHANAYPNGSRLLVRFRPCHQTSLQRTLAKEQLSEASYPLLILSALLSKSLAGALAARPNSLG